MTYSIVARDPKSGELGVAVQSHWFSVGSIVTWARPGVGAVATQANAETAYGPNALALLADGVPAPEALERLVAADPGGPSRQVAIVDWAGRVGAHTGPTCIACAGHITGEGVSCQANIMVSERVWPAMLKAFSAASDSSLTLRLLDALDAAEREGGDLRGRQSAAILVVPAEGEPWRTSVSLRVEDHPEPLPELRRLVALHDAYRLAGHTRSETMMFAWQETPWPVTCPAQAMHLGPVWAPTRPAASTTATCREGLPGSAATSRSSASGAGTPSASRASASGP